jgi:hypothetical protein
MAFLPYWIHGFHNECFHPTAALSGEADEARYLINAGRLYVLEDGGMPVSIARIGRELPTLSVVNLVYTPPYLRQKGYASALVAAVSHKILEQGRLSCVLYTDAANPVSNSIYKKIGYVHFGDTLEIKFHV